MQTPPPLGKSDEGQPTSKESTMIKRIGLAVVAAIVGLGLFATSAAASMYPHHPVSKRQFASVSEWDEASHVEILWGLEGHRTNRWTNSLGRFKTKTYPTHIAGNTARAVYIRYTLDPASDPHPDYVWALYKTKWCVEDQASTVTCSPAPPA